MTWKRVSLWGLAAFVAIHLEQCGVAVGRDTDEGACGMQKTQIHMGCIGSCMAAVQWRADRGATPLQSHALISGVSHIDQRSLFTPHMSHSVLWGGR
jgi:hypothetical protein